MAKKVRKTRGTSPASVKMSLALSPEKVKRIQQCLKKGKLTITVASVSELGRGGNGYQYD